MSVHRHCDQCGKEDAGPAYGWFVVTRADGGGKKVDLCRIQCASDYFAAEVEKREAFIAADVEDIAASVVSEGP